MANNVKVKNIIIRLNGETHELKYDMNSMCEVEERYGDIETAFKKLQENNKSFNTLRFLLWAGLLHEDEKLTQYQVGKMINFLDIDKVEELTESIYSAIDVEGTKEELEKKS